MAGGPSLIQLSGQMAELLKAVSEMQREIALTKARMNNRLVMMSTRMRGILLPLPDVMGGYPATGVFPATMQEFISMNTAQYFRPGMEGYEDYAAKANDRLDKLVAFYEIDPAAAPPRRFSSDGPSEWESKYDAVLCFIIGDPQLAPAVDDPADDVE